MKTQPKERSYGNRLKILMKNKDVDQKKVAEGLDVTPQALSQVLQRAFPSLEKVIEILHILGVSPGEFFKDDSDEGLIFDEDEQEILSLYKELPAELKSYIMDIISLSIESLHGKNFSKR